MGVKRGKSTIRPLKRSMSGYEIEYSLVDSSGDSSNGADTVINSLKKEQRDFPIKKELGKNMIEIISFPHVKVHKTALDLIDNVQRVIDSAEKNNLHVYPFGTYPGKSSPLVRKGVRYSYSAKALGADRFNTLLPRCFGYHYHYSAPRGVFDRKKGVLRHHFRSKVKETLIDSYNFLVASDPFVTAFTQSSPFDNGKFLAKDSRMLLFRGGKKLRYKGMYNNFQLLGGLQPYKQTLADLMSTIRKKDQKMKLLLQKGGVPQSFINKKHLYDLMWNPVKINRLGTVEQRGMDSNFLAVCLGVGVMLKFILKAVQQDFVHVIPSDIGIDEPFKKEGNIIYVPPHSLIRNEYQHRSAHYGFSDNLVYDGTRRFFKLAKGLVSKEYRPTLRVLSTFIEDRETTSDRIITFARRGGCTPKTGLTADVSRKIALHFSDRLRKNLDKTRLLYEKVEESL